MMKAERIVDVAEAFEGAEALIQNWAEAESLGIAGVLFQCWAEVFFVAAEDLCGGSRGLESKAMRTESS